MTTTTTTPPPEEVEEVEEVEEGKRIDDGLSHEGRDGSIPSFGRERRSTAAAKTTTTTKTTKTTAPAVCDVDRGVEGGGGFVEFDGGVFSMNGKVDDDASVRFDRGPPSTNDEVDDDAKWVAGLNAMFSDAAAVIAAVKDDTGGGGDRRTSPGRSGMVIVVDDGGVGHDGSSNRPQQQRQRQLAAVSNFLREERLRKEEEEARRRRNLVRHQQRPRRPSANATSSAATSSSGPPVRSVMVIPATPTSASRDEKERVGDEERGISSIAYRAGSTPAASTLRLSLPTSSLGRLSSPPRHINRPADDAGTVASIESIKSPSSSSVRRMMAKPTLLFQGKERGKFENSNDETSKIVHHIVQNFDGDEDDVNTKRMGDDNSNPARIVSPEKEDERIKDPDLDVYPSESSLSELSLDCFNSTDDDIDDGERYQHNVKIKKHNKKERRQRQAHSKPPLHPGQDGDNNRTKSAGPFYSNDASEGCVSSDDSDTELYAVIAGVRKLNRRTSGKNAPQNKRCRRRRRRSNRGSGSSASSFSSHGSSLLDEVIPEEGELNLSNEAPTGGDGRKELPSQEDATKPIFVPGVIASSSPPPPTKKKTKNDHSASSRGDQEEECRPSLNESGDHCTIRTVSDSEESLSARAARVRRQRILSEQRRFVEGGVDVGGPSLPDKFMDDDDNDDVPDRHYKINKNGRDCVSDRGINNRPPPSAIVMTYGHDKNISNRSVDNNSDHNAEQNNFAWQARQVRMARLRLVRGSETLSAEAATASVSTVSGAKLEPGGRIVRKDSTLSACYSSDESSI
jgi:hypothetical protein